MAAIPVLLLLLATGTVILFADKSILETMRSPETFLGRLRLVGPSVSSALALAVAAVFKTALAEELLFRGFLAQYLIHRFGFQTGNFVQAFLFGFIHLLLFAGLTGLHFLPLLLIFLLATLAGWAAGWLMTRKAGSSILPGWIAHALANVIAYSIIAFGG